MLTRIGLVVIPDERLRTPCVEVKRITKKVKKLADNMLKFMQAMRGAGLSANQINRTEKICVVDDGMRFYTLVNPELTYMSIQRVLLDEGCLSIPGIKSKVERSVHIKVKGKTLDGEDITYDLRGLAAQAFQHEIDHLNGTLFIDRLTPLRKKMVYNKIRRLVKAIRKAEKDDRK